jgi:dolichyl-diphosphooligosaccharide---protein glycosyltransferase
MVRIGGGVFPDIKESDYLSDEGQYRVDEGAGKALLESTMYRLSYYRFADLGPMLGGPRGYDRVRQSVIAVKDIRLKYFEEVFTSEHWMMRVYRVLEVPNREVGLENPYKARGGKKARKKARVPTGALA